MGGEQPAGAGSTISGGTFHGPVLQAGTIHASFPSAAAPVALAQLPPVTAGFTGRDDELGVLAGLLDLAGTPGAVVVSAVAGLAGVGKTTLAVQAGHAAIRSGWCRGGVLFIDLHGYDDAPIEPISALDALLRALGVPAEHIPATVEERAGLYRSALAQISEPVLVIADKRLLRGQVRPLLPGAGPHKVLVTSRHTLAGLGARLVDVTVLDGEASIALLERALRAARPADDRINGDRDAAVELAGVCGGLPLALQITAALLSADPPLTAAELVKELASESARLERLRYDDGGGPGAPSVAAAFELSYRGLEEIPARIFRPDISTATAAVLAGIPVGEVRRVLAGLARAHLAEAAPAAGGRWRIHDLLRLYAQRLSDEHADADGREQARDRLLGYYLDMAGAADGHLRALPGVIAPGVSAGRDEALAWLDAERLSLIAAVTLAASTGRDQIAMPLPLRLAVYFGWRRRFDDRLSTAGVSRDAARRLGDRAGEATALNNIGLALRNLRRFTEAVAAHRDAAAIYRQTGDRSGEGGALSNLGLVLQEVRRFNEAITAQRDAAALFQETGDRHLEGMALSNLGSVLSQARRFEEAITAQQEAAAIFREIGDRHSQGMALGNLGTAMREMERFDEAIAAHQEAAAIFREAGDQHSESVALGNLQAARSAQQA
jgi:tetratricopeptide (TPR) repeat protein